MRIGTTDRENVSRRQMTNTIKDRKKRLRKALKKQVQEDQKNPERRSGEDVCNGRGSMQEQLEQLRTKNERVGVASSRAATTTAVAQMSLIVEMNSHYAHIVLQYSFQVPTNARIDWFGAQEPGWHHLSAHAFVRDGGHWSAELHSSRKLRTTILASGRFRDGFHDSLCTAAGVVGTQRSSASRVEYWSTTNVPKLPPLCHQSMILSLLIPTPSPSFAHQKSTACSTSLSMLSLH